MPCCVHPHYVPCQTMLTHLWDCCDCEHNLVLQAASGRPGDDWSEIVWLTYWDACRRPSVSTVEGLLEQALQLPCIMPVRLQCCSTCWLSTRSCRCGCLPQLYTMSSQMPLVILSVPHKQHSDVLVAMLACLHVYEPPLQEVNQQISKG